MPHPSDDDLALLALGEPAPDALRHVRGCPSCQGELTALTATVRTARDADLSALPPPPSTVWDRVREELGLAPPPAVPGPRQGSPVSAPAPSARPGPSGRRRHGRTAHARRGRLAAAGAALASVAVLAGGALLLGERGPGDTPPGVVLSALGDAGGRGQATVTSTADGRALQVSTQDLSAPDGFYEVWLLDPERDRLLALGTLDASGQAELTLPAGVDLADYPTVDVSAEPDDGDPRHSGDSVLRGDLPA